MKTWVVYFRHIPPEMYHAPSYCIANQSVGGIQANTESEAETVFRRTYDQRHHCTIDSIELSPFQARE
jgi:hypothetical protein